MAIYLDHNATTALDARVLDAMLPYLRDRFGNASSGHGFGREARAAVELAREQVAALVNAHPSQVVFTSGGTEANNTALKGCAARLSPGHILLSAVEHNSVRASAQALQQQGWMLAEMAVESDGQLDMDAVHDLLSRLPADSPLLMALMLANNETGIIYDTATVAELARDHNAILLVDAVQAAGKMTVDFRASGAQLMSLSAHKLYGPKGVGALIVDKAVDMMPLLHGGGHEKGRRAGSENVAAIVGFGKAAELAHGELAARRAHMKMLHQYLETRLVSELPQATIFGVEAERLSNTTFFALPGLDGETLLINLDQAGLAVSSGSACNTGEVEPSHVLLAMGVSPECARGAIRVSLGKDSRRDEIDQFIDCLKQQARSLQRFASLAYA
ncbi:MAG TPA: cysteine desulfurase [Gammaproteobacteria bacterium]|nr:cysteine desulfurase [Gammaproteobacteria bacterium]